MTEPQRSGQDHFCQRVGRLMSKYLDKSKVEQAFKRAARTAVSGDREARSGGFMAQKDKPKSGALASKAPRKGK